MNDNKTLSYTAAGNVPIKMLTNPYLAVSISNTGRIIPIHAQIMPTNKCNLNCSFCSCSKRDKKKEMSKNQLKDILETLYSLRCKAVTITGGGEPLMHPYINGIIQSFYNKDMSIGLVTNGFLLGKLDQYTLEKLTWCRISLGDDRNFEALKPIIQAAVDKVTLVSTGVSLVDFAFSYVINEDPNLNSIAEAVEFANKNKFTHVRLVPDLFNVEKIAPKMEEIKEWLKFNLIDDSLVIYQTRDEYTTGAEKCWISMLKPVFDPDGYVYPCCGVQYALAKPGRKMEKSMRICKAKDFVKYINSGKPFSGKKCVKCYYDNYNKYLAIMKEGLKHEVFV